MTNQEHKMANRIILAMAYNRQGFKDKVEEHLQGALLEFYKHTLAERNGYSKWVQHWKTEVKNLLERSLFSALRHSVRGFKDRRKAVVEVINYIKSDDRAYRNAASKVIKRDYDVVDLTHGLTDTDTEEFWQKVDQILELADPN